MTRKLAEKWLILTAFLIYLIVLLTATLFTHNYYTYGRSSNLVLFSSVRLMLASHSILLIGKNIAGNVLLFLPFGLLFPLLKTHDRFFGTLFAGMACSLLIELCQYYFAARIFDIDDVLLNFIGTLIGRLSVVIYRLVSRRLILFFSIR
ncbi:MAG: VanZ family protein [Sporolactobacillus sp.]